VKTCAQYIADTKAKLGDERMSDEKLGSRWGVSQSFISRAKRGNMADTVAVKIAEVLGIEAGEVLMVARMEREKDPAVRAHLERWVDTVGKALRSVPKKAEQLAVLFGVALAVAVGASIPRDAYAVEGGGKGR